MEKIKKADEIRKKQGNTRKIIQGKIDRTLHEIFKEISDNVEYDITEFTINWNDDMDSSYDRPKEKEWYNNIEQDPEYFKKICEKEGFVVTMASMDISFYKLSW